VDIGLLTGPGPEPDTGLVMILLYPGHTGSVTSRECLAQRTLVD
jgi:hypothetical protein